MKLRTVHPAIVWSILSGFAALIYQVVLQKVFSYVLGYALLSTTTVVAAYMLGLALGGFLAGIFCDRLSRRTSLAFYSAIEALIGVLGIGSLIGYKVYLGSLAKLIEDPRFVHLMSAVPFRATLALATLLPMTILMGATLPIMILGVAAQTRAGSSRPSTASVSITQLYSANLLGGMAGVIVSAYFVMPAVGLWGATVLACCANLFIALLVLAYRSSIHAHLDPAEQPAASAASPAAAASAEHISWGMACFLSFGSGLIMFALEIIWTHLLGAVIGLSVYAFANMLIAVFIGLYLAAQLEADAGSKPSISLSRLVLWGSILLAISIPFYAWAPLLFSALGLMSPGFLVRDVALLAVGCLLIVPVAILLSRIFPRLLAVGVDSEHKGRQVGFLLAINTFGCLLGLFLGNFVLIPLFGSQIALKGLAVILGLIAWIVARRSTRTAASPQRPLSRLGLVAAALALLAVVVPSWPPRLLLSARSIYFSLNSEGQFKPLYYLGEDAEGGFVTVSGSAGGVTEMRTDGKFQGDNHLQMPAQFSFGYLPALAARRTDRAFVIGCGTAVTSRALADAGMRHITVAEISKSILYAADNYFHKENAGILDDPRVTVVHDDGRNALLLSSGRYDLITIELTSIWFAGAANLYSSDFYSIAHRKLVPGGIFQQWVQLHHMRIEDLYVLLNTIHREFKYVAVWYSGSQGQILASDQPITLDWQRLKALAVSNPSRDYISSADIYRIPYTILLDQSNVRQFTSLDTLDALVGHDLGQSAFPRLSRIYLDGFLNSDFYPYLEYATPRGNAIEHLEFLNLAYLRKLVGSPVVIPFRNLPPADLPLAKSLIDYRIGACDHLESASGPASLQAGPGFFAGCAPAYAIGTEASQ